MRTPAELEQIREANRRALGMAGVSMAGIALGDSILTTALGAGGPAHVSASFPAVDYEWDPSQPAQPATGQSTTSQFGMWMLRHVHRPIFEWGGVRWAPGDGYPDYSNTARVAAWGAGLTLASIAAWIIYRAFSKQRRANPRITTTNRYLLTGRYRPRRAA